MSILVGGMLRKRKKENIIKMKMEKGGRVVVVETEIYSGIGVEKAMNVPNSRCIYGAVHCSLVHT